MDIINSDGLPYILASIISLFIAFIISISLGILPVESTIVAFQWFIMILSLSLSLIMAFIGIKIVISD